MNLVEEQAYQQRVATLASGLVAASSAPLGLAKQTSNLFRDRSEGGKRRLDLSDFTHVLEVDAAAGALDTEGLVTYEELVDATLPYGVMPAVVPQLKTITAAGAVAGVGIEATSFRQGLVHDTLLAIDVLLPGGDVVHCTPDNEHRDLFFGFPNSYGTLGYALRLRLRTLPVLPYVKVQHRRHDSAASFFADLAAQCDSEVDFVDGVVFGPERLVLSVARFNRDAPREASDYSFESIYYRSLLERDEDVLTVRGYLWRWDTDWFWCSRAFGAQNPKIRRFWPKQYLRSSFYWKLIALDHKYDIGDRLEKRKGKPPRERVVQDVEVPIERTADFVSWFLEEIPIEPLWLCPLRLREPSPAAASASRPWPLYPLEPKRTYVNIGFWSSVPIVPGEREGAANRLIEEKVSDFDGHKSLYSDSYYSKEDFEELYYGGDRYIGLKERYDPKSRLLDLFSKAVQRK